MKEVEVYGDQPTRDGVTLITSIASLYTGGAWTITTTQTTSEAYLEFHGQSVLEALQTLAEVTGDHFVLGNGRVVNWLGPAATWCASGYRAIGPLTGLGAETGYDSLPITRLRRIEDAGELVTRIIPLAGSGSKRVDLSATSRAAPAGYTLVKTPTAPALPYLKHDASEAAFGMCGKVVRFNNLRCMELNSWYQHPEYAANQLYDAARAYLDTHCDPAFHYELEVGELRALLHPAITLQVVYQEWTDGQKTLDIDTYQSGAVCILCVRYRIDGRGILVTGLVASNVERLREDGTLTVERLLQDVHELAVAGQAGSGTSTVVQQITSSDADINGGSIDGTPIGSDTPASGSFTTLSFVSIGNHAHTGSGNGGQLSHDNLAGVSASDHHAPVTLGAGSAGELSLSGQELSLAAVLTPTEHTAIGNGSPHHAPVTAGTGISLIGQQVAINLAADLTWTGNQTFQGQNSHRHLLPEATDTYDIGSATRLWRAGYLSTLYSIIFAESTIQLIGGAFMIPRSTGTLPDVGSGDNVIEFGQVMTVGDHLLIKSYDSGGVIKSEYMRIEESGGGTTYRVTRDEAGAHAIDPAWADGTPYAVLGQAGNGRIELDAVTSPRISILTQGAAYNDQDEVFRAGDLNSNWGYSSPSYGLAVGAYATGKANLTYDPGNGLRLRIYNTDSIQLDTAGNALITNKLQLKGASSALAIGSTPPTSASAGTGVWLDRTGLYALTSNAARTVVNAGGLRVARDSNGLRFVSNASILTDTDATDGRIFHQSSDGALVVRAPSGYLNIDVGTAALRANIAGAPAFWKLMSKGTSSPGNANSDVQLAFGTINNNYAMLEQASGKPLLNLYLGTGASPQRQGGFFHQQTAPTYVPLYRMVSLNVAASGGTGYIGSQDYGDGTYIQFAHVMLVGFKVADGTSQMWCYGSLYKPGSSYNAIFFTTDRGAVSATSGEHFVYLNSSGQLAIRNNSGAAFHYIGWAVTTQS